MFSQNVFKIEACTYDQLSMHSEVFNTSELGYTLYVSLPTLAMVSSTPIEVIETAVEDAEDILDQCKWRPGGCWIDVLCSAMNMNVGYHKYRITLLDQITNVTRYLYFAYTLQNDTPDKPYVYMETHKLEDQSDENS